MLELKKIKKSYKVGDNIQPVLKGIDIKFRKNEFTAILGSSGSGKTTLLNIIGGLDKYDSGDLIIEGISTKKYQDRDWDAYRNHRVGFIFQSYNLIMHQSVLANVEIALTLSGISKQERKKRATDALIKVGLKEHINKQPNQLSGGQMQRVAIARALVNDPEIILADEPTGALDSKTSVQIMDLLKEIAGDRLVIMVTHNPELATEYSNRIIELKDGLIINDSNPFDGKEEETKSKEVTKTSMSLMSALTLSLNNLLTKKGRTFLTAFAGSIGIIGIALILSLSNGVNNMAKQLERDSLSDYPISIERTSYDLFGAISASMDEVGKKEECPKDKLCSKDDIVKKSNISASKGLVQKNNIKEFTKYVNENDGFKKNSDFIEYTYNMDLQVYTPDYVKVNPSDLIISDSQDSSNSIFQELPPKAKKYKVLAGKVPEGSNEIAVIVGANNTIDDSLLYSLNIKNRDDLTKDLAERKKDSNYKVKSTELTYDDILNKKYKLILNTDYYKEENGIFLDYSYDTDYMKDKIDNGEELTIVGILKDKDASSSHVGYNHDTTMDVIDKVSKTPIYEKQINNKNINVLTNTAAGIVTGTAMNVAKDKSLTLSFNETGALLKGVQGNMFYEDGDGVSTKYTIAVSVVDVKDENDKVIGKKIVVKAAEVDDSKTALGTKYNNSFILIDKDGKVRYFDNGVMVKLDTVVFGNQILAFDKDGVLVGATAVEISGVKYVASADQMTLVIKDADGNETESLVPGVYYSVVTK